MTPPVDPDDPGPYPRREESLGRVLSAFGEGAMVEEPAVARLAELGWRHENLYTENPLPFAPDPRTGRISLRQAMLPGPLRAAVERLNPDLDMDAVSAVIEELMRNRSDMNPVAANREVIGLLRDGVETRIALLDGASETRIARVIDWRDWINNDCLLAQQFWIASEIHKRRADLVGFVNGVPLLFVELKASHRNAQAAYDENLRDYRDAVPHIFWGNGIVVLSNGADARIGAPFAQWGHFKEWKRIDDEGAKGVVSLDTVLTAACSPERLLDIVENFVVFEETRDGLIKKIAQNHQYLGVNKAVAEIGKAQGGRLGVFWHTQGSGKSLSMLTFTQKVLRTKPGGWTFLIVTDRQELDNQIAEFFQACGAFSLPLPKVQAQSRAHLRTLLAGNARFVFTLIQKFGTEMGETHPELSQRDDIIVVTDEAHRSQYDVLAANMRRALPNAAFIGFTGTPLMAGEEKTREVFGDYISVYNFSQSVEDGATVPLYYENRIPELQLADGDLDEAVEAIIAEADFDDDDNRALERKLARQYSLIKREDRLDRIAEDVVRHFMGRGYRGKAMFIAIDKETAVRMHGLVRAAWDAALAEKAKAIQALSGEAREAAQAELKWLHETDMAVVVSQGQNEIADMAAKGLDIRPHRERMVREDLDEKFKAPGDPLRLVFVCAMWITGFDVPTCSTVYLDKPMKNHTLMQTIARANRTAPGKSAGLIVDYVGVFRNLQKALAIYAQPSTEGTEPIENKAALVVRLKAAADEAMGFCRPRNVDPHAIVAAQGFARIAKLADAVDAMMGTDAEQQTFLRLAGAVWTLFKAVLPDPAADEWRVEAAVLHIMAEKVRSVREDPAKKARVQRVADAIEALLDDAILGIEITAPIRTGDDMAGLFDLSRIDFDKLREQFAKGEKRTRTQQLRTAIERKLEALAAQNPTRNSLVERFHQLIAEYNAGSLDVERLFEALMRFIRDLDEEEHRSVREGLTEEELAIFDILTKPEPELTAAETDIVKQIARNMLDTLKREKLVLDWRLKERAKAAVRNAIQQSLDSLPPPYVDEIWHAKTAQTYEWVFDHYPGGEA
ncbi:MAG: putative type restriction enzyme hindVIIP protein [Bradyrhizobium sp.]|nr:putative type restriction enzyme hindVIIP protein [Bradyrhizobium sp.]